ncbi:MAG: gamma-glutamyltranspeptidase [Alphaproteobacteria bacterium]|nr:gamma-glutamyltranspeptidase [Alphaproteobacteria bacterium]
MHGKRPTIASRHGMVAAAHPLAAAAGARILAAGGNAFDAAVATAAALNVVEPYMSGLAGQGLATCYVAAEKAVKVLDFVPRIPAHFPVERFSRRQELSRGGAPIGAPGNLAGWCTLRDAYGSRPLSELFAPAVALARDGFPLAEFNVEEINGVSGELRQQPAGAIWAANYGIGSQPARLGDILRQPDLAGTLEALAAEGPGLLYGGALGKRVVEHVAAMGGSLDMSDLLAVKPEWKTPLAISYRGHSINLPPPPCEGFQTLLTLRVLEGLDLPSRTRDGLEHLDLVLRAIRLAAGVRIAHSVPTPARIAELLSDTHVARLRARVLDGTPIDGPTEQWTPPATPAKGESHTTSFSMADRHGNLVCVTQSLGAVFGSGVVVPGTGLCLNNFLFWTDVNPASPNRSKPGAVMPICMAPMILTKDERAVLALGTPGSYGILQTQAQALVQLLDYGLPLQEAIEAPRARLTDGRLVTVENRVGTEVLQGLAARGHIVDGSAAWTMKTGGMQGVAVDPDTGALTGGCDPRRDGYCVPA